MNKIYLILLVIPLFACKNKNSTLASRVERLPFYNEATFTPIWVKLNSNAPDDFHKIPPFNFVNQDGQIITEKTFKDKIYVADFFFTSCPGICPQMTKNMNLVQAAFKNDDEVLLLSHSVTPKLDSVSVLKNYANAHGVISGKWHLVTGKQQDIYDMGRKSYFVEEDLGIKKSLTEFLHTENFVLIDKNKHIRGIYNGLNKTSVNQLIKDIYLLKDD